MGNGLICLPVILLLAGCSTYQKTETPDDSFKVTMTLEEYQSYIKEKYQEIQNQKALVKEGYEWIHDTARSERDQSQLNFLRFQEVFVSPVINAIPQDNLNEKIENLNEIYKVLLHHRKEVPAHEFSIAKQELQQGITTTASEIFATLSHQFKNHQIPYARALIARENLNRELAAHFFRNAARLAEKNSLQQADYLSRAANSILGSDDYAQFLLLKALEIQKNHLPETHPAIIQNFEDLGTFYHMGRHYKAASYYFEKTIPLKEQTNDITIYPLYEILLDIYLEMENQDKAAVVYKKLFEFSKKSPSHYDLAQETLDRHKDSFSQ